MQLTNPVQREKVLIASKWGIVRDKHDPRLRGVNISPAYIEKQLDGILCRLNLDYLDIFYIHRMTGQVNDDELGLCVEKMKKLKQACKIRAVGLS